MIMGYGSSSCTQSHHAAASQAHEAESPWRPLEVEQVYPVCGRHRPLFFMSLLASAQRTLGGTLATPADVQELLEEP